MQDIKLILSRAYKPDETLGTYIIMDGNEELYRCRCMELPWLNNQKDISCIPGERVYDVEKYSDKKHPNCFLIKDVPGRSGILIHIANFATGAKIDLKGCQAPGLSFKDIDGNNTPDIAGSTIALEAMNHFLPTNFKLFIL